MKIYILSLGIILNGLLSDSECSGWYKGNIYLANGSVTKGEIRYCLDHDVVMLKNEEQTLTLGPVKVDHFVIFDHFLDLSRSFYALPFEELNGYSRKRFFEVLYRGKISLLNREEEMMVTTDQGFNDGSDLVEWVLIDRYYMLDEHGRISYFSGNTNDLLAFMEGQADVVSTFIDSQQLDTSMREDLITVLQYYNTIQNQ